MITTRGSVELLEKNKPRQARAKRTYEAILEATAKLLIEVGVERISTNLIAEKAGITVPAVYRYFPNKYSVLHALGAVLMDAQNRVFPWQFDNSMANADELVVADNFYELLKLTYDITRQQTAGLEILQCLRAVGPLQELRLRSHQLVARQLTALLAELLGEPENELLAIQARISVDTGYAIVEMALEDTSISATETLGQGAHMLGLYWREILGQRNGVIQ